MFLEFFGGLALIVGLLTRPVEQLGFLGITLQGRLGTGFTSGWKLLMPTHATGARS